jgi:hypothetical protein
MSNTAAFGKPSPLALFGRQLTPCPLPGTDPPLQRGRLLVRDVLSGHERILVSVRRGTQYVRPRRRLVSLTDDPNSRGTYSQRTSRIRSRPQVGRVHDGGWDPMLPVYGAFDSGFFGSSPSSLPAILGSRPVTLVAGQRPELL